MISAEDSARVSKLLRDTISMLCKNSVKFSVDLHLQGLLAVTIDSASIIVVQFTELFQGDQNGESTGRQTTGFAPRLVPIEVKQASFPPAVPRMDTAALRPGVRAPKPRQVLALPALPGHTPRPNVVSPNRTAMLRLTPRTPGSRMGARAGFTTLQNTRSPVRQSIPRTPGSRPPQMSPAGFGSPQIGNPAQRRSLPALCWNPSQGDGARVRTLLSSPGQMSNTVNPPVRVCSNIRNANYSHAPENIMVLYNPTRAQRGGLAERGRGGAVRPRGRVIMRGQRVRGGAVRGMRGLSMRFPGMGRGGVQAIGVGRGRMVREGSVMTRGLRGVTVQARGRAFLMHGTPEGKGAMGQQMLSPRPDIRMPNTLEAHRSPSSNQMMLVQRSTGACVTPVQHRLQSPAQSGMTSSNLSFFQSPATSVTLPRAGMFQSPVQPSITSSAVGMVQFPARPGVTSSANGTQQHVPHTPEDIMNAALCMLAVPVNSPNILSQRLPGNPLPGVLQRMHFELPPTRGGNGSVIRLPQDVRGGAHALPPLPGIDNMSKSVSAVSVPTRDAAAPVSAVSVLPRDTAGVYVIQPVRTENRAASASAASVPIRDQSGVFVIEHESSSASILPPSLVKSEPSSVRTPLNSVPSADAVNQNQSVMQTCVVTLQQGVQGSSQSSNLQQHQMNKRQLPQLQRREAAQLHAEHKKLQQVQAQISGQHQTQAVEQQNMQAFQQNIHSVKQPNIQTVQQQGRQAIEHQNMQGAKQQHAQSVQQQAQHSQQQIKQHALQQQAQLQQQSLAPGQQPLQQLLQGNVLSHSVHQQISAQTQHQQLAQNQQHQGRQSSQQQIHMQQQNLLLQQEQKLQQQHFLQLQQPLVLQMTRQAEKQERPPGFFLHSMPINQGLDVLPASQVSQLLAQHGIQEQAGRDPQSAQCQGMNMANQEELQLWSMSPHQEQQVGQQFGHQQLGLKNECVNLQQVGQQQKVGQHQQVGQPQQVGQHQKVDQFLQQQQHLIQQHLNEKQIDQFLCPQVASHTESLNYSTAGGIVKLTDVSSAASRRVVESSSCRYPVNRTDSLAEDIDLTLPPIDYTAEYIDDGNMRIGETRLKGQQVAHAASVVTASSKRSGPVPVHSQSGPKTSLSEILPHSVAQVQVTSSYSLGQVQWSSSYSTGMCLSPGHYGQSSGHPNLQAGSLQPRAAEAVSSTVRQVNSAQTGMYQSLYDHLQMSTDPSTQQSSQAAGQHSVQQLLTQSQVITTALQLVSHAQHHQGLQKQYYQVQSDTSEPPAKMPLMQLQSAACEQQQTETKTKYTKSPYHVDQEGSSRSLVTGNVSSRRIATDTLNKQSLNGIVSCQERLPVYPKSGSDCFEGRNKDSVQKDKEHLDKDKQHTPRKGKDRFGEDKERSGDKAWNELNKDSDHLPGTDKDHMIGEDLMSLVRGDVLAGQEEHVDDNACIQLKISLKISKEGRYSIQRNEPEALCNNNRLDSSDKEIGRKEPVRGLMYDNPGHTLPLDEHFQVVDEGTGKKREMEEKGKKKSADKQRLIEQGEFACKDSPNTVDYSEYDDDFPALTNAQSSLYSSSSATDLDQSDVYLDPPAILSEMSLGSPPTKSSLPPSASSSGASLSPHAGANPTHRWSCTAQSCFKKFALDANLAAHYTATHRICFDIDPLYADEFIHLLTSAAAPGTHSIPCPFLQCGRCFETVSGVCLHYVRKHKIAMKNKDKKNLMRKYGGQLIHCDHCTRVFTNKTELAKHLSRVQRSKSVRSVVGV